MGRWAQARKRGRVSTGYPVLAPTPGDFSVTQPGGPGLMTVVNRLVSFPPGAVYMRVYYLINGASATQLHSATTPINLNIFAPGTVLQVRTAWLDSSTVQISEFSPYVFYTTT